MFDRELTGVVLIQSNNDGACEPWLFFHYCHRCVWLQVMDYVVVKHFGPSVFSFLFISFHLEHLFNIYSKRNRKKQRFFFIHFDVLF